MDYQSISITKEFFFDAAHRLEKTKSKCETLHGHTWKVQVTVTEELKDDGMVHDFTDMKKIIDHCVRNRLDHSYLNDFIEQPTAENIGLWIYRELKPHLAHISKIRVYESPTSYATITFF
ncbi:MAG: 6-carboxytetrahydropterin synthase QueD [Candidatus Aureabacteria bacterium]|nr:6-carboxytetrahydropterin synthase QueD [Candidatus Auribacterota bacterium]